jgi:hypothetical protein
MHQIDVITVRDRAGLHTGTYVPPKSRQRKTASLRPRFDKAAILRRAWSDYRAAIKRTPAFLRTKEDDARRWSYCLGMAWAFAKAAVQREEELAALDARLRVMVILPATSRAAEIDTELLALDMIDRQSTADIARIGELQSELSRLSAH